MSTDPALSILLNAARQQPSTQIGSDESWLDEILERELASISASMPEWHTTSCLLHDVGNFLSRSTLILSRLAERVVNGQELMNYAQERVVEMEKDHDLSELDSLDYLNEKHSSLKSVASTLHGTVDELNAVWISSRKPPFQGIVSRNGDRPSSVSSSEAAKLDSESSASSPTTELPVCSERLSSVEPKIEHEQQHRPSSLPAVEPAHSVSDTSQASDSMHNAVQELLLSLSVRGTGQYICPYGTTCGKGGMRNGLPVVFGRNSAFRAHLQKHEKMYKCDLPGCTAKGGFARVDQLRRHQTTVPHNTQ